MMDADDPSPDHVVREAIGADRPAEQRRRHVDHISGLLRKMAQFGNRRLGVQWNASSSFGFSTFSASHASSLKDMTWLLPRDKYWLPVVISGAGQVSYDSTYWVVTANSGTTLKFIAAER